MEESDATLISLYKHFINVWIISQSFTNNLRNYLVYTLEIVKSMINLSTPKFQLDYFQVEYTESPTKFIWVWSDFLFL